MVLVLIGKDPGQRCGGCQGDGFGRPGGRSWYGPRRIVRCEMIGDRVKKIG